MLKWRLLPLVQTQIILAPGGQAAGKTADAGATEAVLLLAMW